MDFIKKHFEKILLAVVLLILLGVALVLWRKVDALSEQVRAGISLPAGKSPLSFTATVSYSNAIDGLKTPGTWRVSPVDPFHSEIEIYMQPRTGPTNPVVQPKVIKPFVLVRITRKQFRMMFKSYTGQGENFAINDGRRTFIVQKVGDRVWNPVDKVDTGFVVTKFEKKEAMIEVAGIGKHLHDISELTIQHGTDAPVLLVLLRVTEEREPVAVITCQADNQDLPVRKGQNLVCGGKVYNVVDITLKQVIIVDDETKEKLTVSKE